MFICVGNRGLPPSHTIHFGGVFSQLLMFLCFQNLSSSTANVVTFITSPGALFEAPPRHPGPSATTTTPWFPPPPPPPAPLTWG
ncbi:hypothetical protein EDD21DRAFT_362092 [Dissophora ornata]|nr:hypothetical protein EDD21DRAFT_362092 [Dissophora ornata]